MLTESPVEMLPEVGMGPVIAGGERFDEGDELALLLRDQRRREAAIADRERELSLFRSGSAPPTVEGSLAAVKSGFLSGGNGFVSEEAVRADPAYLEYYYSHVNLNPRLPPPVLSKEDWRLTQRLHLGNAAAGGTGDRWRSDRAEDGGCGSNSPFAQQPKFGSFQGVDAGGDGRKEWVDRGEGDGLIGLSGLSLGSRQKSFAEILQDDMGHTALITSHPSRPLSRNAFYNDVETPDFEGKQFANSCHDRSVIKSMHINDNSQNVDNIQPGRQAPRTFASVLSGSLSRASTPDSQLLKRTTSPSLPPVGSKIGSKDKVANNGFASLDVKSSVPECADIVGSFSGLNLSQNNIVGQENQHHLRIHQEAMGLNPFDLQALHGHIQRPSSIKKSEVSQDALPLLSRSADLPYLDFREMPEVNQNNFSMNPDGNNYLQNPVDSPSNTYLKFSHATSLNSPGNSPTQYQKNSSFGSFSPNYGQTGMYANSSLPQLLANQIGSGCLPPLFENAARMSAMGYSGLESFDLGSMSSGLSVEDLQLNLNASAALAAGLQIPFVDPLCMQYLRAAEYASHINYNDPLMDRHYPGNAYMDAFGLLKAHIGTVPSLEKQYGMPILGPGSPIRHGEKNTRFSIGMRNLSRGLMGSWHSDGTSNAGEGFPFTLLDEFKNNKNRSFELIEIAGHVVEFSADQYGSRFIQQKLETASTEEKNMVFEEILPQALALMTDVFGNYVIQKFFEHGSPSQTRELANQLIGHVLTLSLQMYGCRVIQKAIEVVELDQQTKMVAELDGHVMRCVRDQNGNHVIQKCIECIPQNAIQFIISSFYGQVVTLSTHPYGCRVIQRVLEHCHDPKTQKIVMDEIFQCVCMLAQDQYGNYVVQHILEHGKPEERSSILEKLAGQIVQMSQQKFASNVIEKCLTFSTPEERKFLVNEMLGTTDENEPLQAMMKDQFANYVVQKALETCDDQQRELMLTRIKLHLNALKKYTYGKHIVARVEKLVAAGERRLEISSPSPLIA